MQVCPADIRPQVPSRLSDQTSRRLPSLRGCRTSTTARWRRRVHGATRRRWNDRRRRPGRRRHVSCPVRAPPTTCCTAVATSWTEDRTSGRHQRRRHWIDRALTADDATCMTSHGGETAAETRRGWKTGSMAYCHSQPGRHRRPSELSHPARYAANRPPALLGLTSSMTNSHGRFRRSLRKLSIQSKTSCSLLLTFFISYVTISQEVTGTQMRITAGICCLTQGADTQTTNTSDPRQTSLGPRHIRPYSVWC